MKHLQLHKSPSRDLIAVGILSTVLGLFATLVFGRTTLIGCTRLEPSQVNCISQTMWFGLLPLADEIVYRQVESVMLTETCSGGGEGCQAGLSIRYEDQRSASITSLNDAAARRAARVLTAYLSEPTSTTVAINGNRPARTMLGFTFIVIPFLSVGAAMLYAGIKREV